MTTEKVEKANELIRKINNCEQNIKKATYTQSENVEIRKAQFMISYDSSVEVPETLFRVIGKLILSEYNQKLIELKKEFDEL